MKNYLLSNIGKQAKAERMTLAQYVAKTGQDVMKLGTSADTIVYLVEWPDGLVDFWFEKDFEKQAVELNSIPEFFDFGIALNFLKEGKMLSRKCWAKGSFVYLQVDAEINVDQISLIKSFPNSVKSEFEERAASENFLPIRFKNFMAMVSPENIITNYNPPNLDVLAADWYVL